jgi:leucyl/phenylalanyl-tRNA--protein transferase
MLLLPDSPIPSFPDPHLADNDGLLAIGGRLSVNWLLEAYRKGIFPWFSEGDPILWHSPPERFVLFPEKLAVSKSMKNVLRSGTFRITFNEAFEEVIANCATIARKDQPGTWITGEMKEAYIRLHHQGYAHSVEAWKNGTLAGGLYGVVQNDIFCGESMFSKVANASKAAFITMCREKRYSLVDCQVYTSHLESLGAEMISREDYLSLLSAG